MPEGRAVPDEVRALAAERQQRRADRDFAAADALRDRIAELGYRVVDAPEGSVLEPLETLGPEEGPTPGEVARVPAADVPSVLEVLATFDASVHWVVEGWPQDVLRALEGFRANTGGRSVQYVVADVTGGDPLVFGPDVEVVSLEEGTGWAAARNAGLRRSRGRIVLAVDGSIEPEGDVLGPLEDALQDPSTGVCGPFGIVTSNLQDFEPSGGPEVDAIEGYLMAFRRELLRDIGFFDEKFRWYRTADIEYSFRVKESGLRARVVPVPVRRHEHRVWSSTSSEDRARWSKRNYYRFLDRFRGRFDLLVSGRGDEVPPGG